MRSGGPPSGSDGSEPDNGAPVQNRRRSGGDSTRSCGISEESATDLRLLFADSFFSLWFSD